MSCGSAVDAMRLFALLSAIVLGGCRTESVFDSRESAPLLRVLVFSKTAGYRHDSIEPAQTALQTLGPEFAWTFSEDGEVFRDDVLGMIDVVMFLNTTGDVLNPDQQSAFERFIQRGRGFVGIHAAADTEYDWPFYRSLVGATFLSHPEIQPAVVVAVDPRDPSTEHLPARWKRSDEWYNFREAAESIAAAGEDRRILLALDTQSYDGDTMGREHPIAWRHRFAGGRAWYTAGGHTAESFADPLFLEHLRRGVLWAGARGRGTSQQVD